jgi:GntR family transcriptional regulator
MTIDKGRSGSPEAAGAGLGPPAGPGTPADPGQPPGSGSAAGQAPAADTSRSADPGRSADPAPAAIEFRLDPASGVPTYRQLVQQVEQALRLGYLVRGDQLPRVKDVVGSLAINPNTVLKAYRELEYRGIAAGRPGQGTFVEAAPGTVPLATLTALRKSMTGWLRNASSAGLDEGGMSALFTAAMRDFHDRPHAGERQPGARQPAGRKPAGQRQAGQGQAGQGQAGQGQAGQGQDRRGQDRRGKAGQGQAGGRAEDAEGVA